MKAAASSIPRKLAPITTARCTCARSSYKKARQRRAQVVDATKVCPRDGEPVDACPCSDEQLAEPELSALFGFDGSARAIDAHDASSQVNRDVALAVVRLIMDQYVRLLWTLEEKVLGEGRTVIGESVFRRKNCDVPSAPPARRVSAAVASQGRQRAKNRRALFPSTAPGFVRFNRQGGRSAQHCRAAREPSARWITFAGPGLAHDVRWGARPQPRRRCHPEGAVSS